MPTNKHVIHTATGEFKFGGYYEPTLPQTGVDAENSPIYDPAYSIVTVPGETMPDPRTEKWDGTGIVSKGVDAIAAIVLAEASAALRLERNARLDASDWTQLADIPIITKETWTLYRQALRDLPQTTTDPANPIWPTSP